MPIYSDVPAPAQSQKPGQAGPRKAGPSRATGAGLHWLLAWPEMLVGQSRRPRPRLSRDFVCLCHSQSTRFLASAHRRRQCASTFPVPVAHETWLTELPRYLLLPPPAPLRSYVAPQPQYALHSLRSAHVTHSTATERPYTTLDGQKRLRRPS